MSETTMREAVLREFTYDAGVHRLWRVADMADEIRRLRDENAALRERLATAEMERDCTLRIHRGLMSTHPHFAAADQEVGRE